MEGSATVASDGGRGRKEQAASEGRRAGRCDATIEVREGGERKAPADQLAARADHRRPRRSPRTVGLVFLLVGNYECFFVLCRVLDLIALLAQKILPLRFFEHIMIIYRQCFKYNLNFFKD